MRNVFDDQQLESVHQSRDRELTLGTGSILAIACALLLVCGICFALGYAAGHNTPAASSAPVPQAATDQEPLQASASIPKPSAVAQTPVAPSQPAQSTTSVAAVDSTAAPAGGTSATLPANSASPQPGVHAALPTTASMPQNSNTGGVQAVHPALTQPQPQGQQFMVQIAAVSNADDAEVLANALRKRNYPVVSRREPADNFIHVRIGPFPSHEIADQWRMKLLNDGYNALVQP